MLATVETGNIKSLTQQSINCVDTAFLRKTPSISCLQGWFVGHVNNTWTWFHQQLQYYFHFCYFISHQQVTLAAEVAWSGQDARCLIEVLTIGRVLICQPVIALRMTWFAGLSPKLYPSCCCAFAFLATLATIWLVLFGCLKTYINFLATLSRHG